MVPIYRGSAYGCTPAYSHTPLMGLCRQGTLFLQFSEFSENSEGSEILLVRSPQVATLQGGQGVRCQYSYFLTTFWPLTM